jgi:hypothetical protein
VTKPELIQKLVSIVDEFEQGRSWGTLEVEFKEGAPHYVRKLISETVREEHAKTHAIQQRRY